MLLNSQTLGRSWETLLAHVSNETLKIYINFNICMFFIALLHFLRFWQFLRVLAGLGAFWGALGRFWVALGRILAALWLLLGALGRS